jgi:hypothetical protein
MVIITTYFENYFPYLYYSRNMRLGNKTTNIVFREYKWSSRFWRLPENKMFLKPVENIEFKRMLTQTKSFFGGTNRHFKNIAVVTFSGENSIEFEYDDIASISFTLPE